MRGIGAPASSTRRLHSWESSNQGLCSAKNKHIIITIMKILNTTTIIREGLGWSPLCGAFLEQRAWQAETLSSSVGAWPASLTVSEV